MGFSNIPFAVGWGLGNILSGPLYMALSEKSVFAKKYLLDHGIAADSLLKENGEDLPLPDLMTKVQEVIGQELNQQVDVYQATQVLWDISFCI